MARQTYSTNANYVLITKNCDFTKEKILFITDGDDIFFLSFNIFELKIKRYLSTNQDLIIRKKKRNRNLSWNENMRRLPVKTNVLKTAENIRKKRTRKLFALKLSPVVS